MKALAAAALLFAFQDEKVEIKWKLEKGEELRYKTSRKSTFDFGGAVMEVEMRTLYTMTVTDADEKGTAGLQSTCDAFAIKMSGFKESEYDSEKDKNPPDEPVVKAMSRMVGQSFSFRMTPGGQVSDVKGFDKIRETLLAGLEEEDEIRAQKKMFKQMFSDESTKATMQEMLGNLPSGKVAQGDAWTNEFSTPLPPLGKMKLTYKSKVKEIKGSDAQMDHDIKADIETDESANGMFEVKEIKGKATSVFAVDKGRLRSSKMEMDITISVGEQEMAGKMTSEVKLVEKK